MRPELPQPAFPRPPPTASPHRNLKSLVFSFFLMQIGPKTWSVQPMLPPPPTHQRLLSLYFYLITLDAGPRRPLSLELCDAKVYAPEIRALHLTVRGNVRGTARGRMYTVSRRRAIAHPLRNTPIGPGRSAVLRALGSFVVQPRMVALNHTSALRRLTVRVRKVHHQGFVV